MATSSSPIVQHMPPFDPDTEIGTNLAPKWKIWVDDFFRSRNKFLQMKDFKGNILRYYPLYGFNAVLGG